MRPFVELVESQLGAKVLFDLHTIPKGRYDLIEPFAIAEMFKKNGILQYYDQWPSLPDEPPLRQWTGVPHEKNLDAVSGASFDSDTAAFFAMLGEALERYLWFKMTDYFDKPVRATTLEIARKGQFIAPERFCGFSAEQRRANEEWTLHADAVYQWTRGVSLVSGKKVYLPAQAVSKAIVPKEEGEPLIRAITTNGLATSPTKLGARLAGILEIIERDAYMIMWLNQLTLPRIALGKLASEDPSIHHLIQKCEQYRLKLHAVRLLTDVPTYAICVVLEDVSGHAPRFAFGLRSHRSLPDAIQGAALEALRARRGYRAYFRAGGSWDPATPVDKIGHIERRFYWGSGNNAAGLEFIIKGTEEQTSAIWENDTEEQHFQRIVEWCRNKEYECIAVDLGRSAANPTPWHVEMMVMPDMQAMYLREWVRLLGGERLREVPQQYGYAPRPEPFVDAPHPFC